ncbi:MAG: glycerate 2-kinase, partial [Paracoccaceae bacterium]
ETLAATLGPRLRDMAPGVMIFGGEPTVVLPPNPGQGGRNQALALSLAREIAGTQGLTILVGGTDGSDGPTDAAGAIVDGTVWGHGAAEALKRADSGRYLDAKGAVLRTGPTGTNVMDLMVALRD